LGVKPIKPKRILSLGDVRLLEMDTSRAAAHFGVPAIIKRRDRKSGLRKRKQWEIEDALRCARKET
jgi:DNA (cytosine-5)-methyltransferase 1